MLAYESALFRLSTMPCELRIHPLEKRLTHSVNGRDICPPFPVDTRCVILGLGCFWGAERLFWNLPGVYITAVGYAGGQTRQPTYHQVCSGTSGHIEVVLLVYQEGVNAYTDLLKVFWESNDPTQGMRCGNDIGEQYQSVIFCANDEQYQIAQRSRDVYQNRIEHSGHGKITTHIAMGVDFYYAEEYHQQYLAKNPDGYCGIKGLGVDLPSDV